MFKIVKEPRAWWPVEWKGVAEAGTIVDHRIELRFRLLKVDATAAFIADVVAATEVEQQPGADLPTTYAELVMRIADDWRGVGAENGEPLPWSLDTLKLLMNEGGLFTHVFNAFRDCLRAAPKARVGN